MARPPVEITFDKKKLRGLQKLLRGIPGALPKIMSRAINRTAAPVRTSMAKQLIVPVKAAVMLAKAQQKGSNRKAPNLRFKMAAIKNNILFEKATRKVWRALILIKRPKGQESTASTEPAFIATMPKSGNIGLFRRLGATRLPIANQLRQLLNKHFLTIKGPVKQDASRRLKQNIDSQTKLVLSQWKARTA